MTFKFEDPLWVAGVIATIGAIGVMLGNLITQFRNGTKLDTNTQLTAATHAQSAEIKTLVNGTQTALLTKLEEKEKALNATHGENRALREMFEQIIRQRDLADRDGTADRRHTRADVRDPIVALPHDESRLPPVDPPPPNGEGIV